MWNADHGEQIITEDTGIETGSFTMEEMNRTIKKLKKARLQDQTAYQWST